MKCHLVVITLSIIGVLVLQLFDLIRTYFILQDKPYNKDDDLIKATSFEVISTLRDVLKMSSLWRDHVQTYTQVRYIFHYFGAFRNMLLYITLQHLSPNKFTHRYK